MKKAENKINEYFRAYMDEDYEKMEKCLDKNISMNKASMKSSTKIVGYSVQETMLIGEKGQFTVKVSSASKTKVSSELDSYNIKVLMNNDSNYSISEIKINAEKEAYYESFGLRLRDKNDAKTDLLIDFDSIPSYAYSKEDKANINKVEVPKKQFGTLSFGYSGDIIAISTFDKIEFYGVAKIGADSVAAANGASGNGSSGNTGTGQGNNQSGNSVREKPVAKEFDSIDILNDGKINLMAFSPDEKFLLVQYTNAIGLSGIKIYNVEKDELIPPNLINSFQTDNTNLYYKYFDNDSLIYKVQVKDKSKTQGADVEGTWKLDLKDFKTEKDGKDE
jgi:hypothetical protein